MRGPGAHVTSCVLGHSSRSSLLGTNKLNGTSRFLPDGQSPLIERLRFSVLSLDAVQLRQIVEGGYVRAICFDMIGKWGVDADLESIRARSSRCGYRLGTGCVYADIPVTFSCSPFTTRDSTCTLLFSDNRATLAAAGHYDTADGALKFTNMRYRGLPRTVTMSCTTPDHTVVRTLLPGGWDALAAPFAESDIRIALGDGERSVISVPAYGGAAQELTIDLTMRRRR
jgi:hypothetical protein